LHLQDGEMPFQISLNLIDPGINFLSVCAPVNPFRVEVPMIDMELLSFQPDPKSPGEVRPKRKWDKPLRLAPFL